VAVVRDVALAAFGLGLILGALWAYTEQPFPHQAPLVVVESGSMMHGPQGPCLDGRHGCSALDRTSFGRVGTIDPGDLVLVKRVREPHEIETAFGTGDRRAYGGHGDVIIFAPAPDQTPIIHRAMLYIEALPEGCRPHVEPCRYRIPAACDEETFAAHVVRSVGDWRDYCAGTDRPITLDLARGGLFLRLEEYPCAQSCGPFHSGFVTKGDNNPHEDSAAQHSPGVRSTALTCCLVTIDQVVGKARGEIPWFGLIKLSVHGNERYRLGGDPTAAPQWTFVRATAPWDIWVSFFASMALLVSLPLLADYVWGRLRPQPAPQGPKKHP
jgi:signal peptidase I